MEMVSCQQCLFRGILLIERSAVANKKLLAQLHKDEPHKIRCAILYYRASSFHCFGMKFPLWGFAFSCLVLVLLFVDMIQIRIQNFYRRKHPIKPWRVKEKWVILWLISMAWLPTPSLPSSLLSATRTSLMECYVTINKIKQSNALFFNSIMV